ncbi:hypothetical protein F511_09114 [Dorcoceras hygrometricum]|uniref:Uncharacterized protein n=1 Tax=Dorcoceras hygrometricum TaxID=472368 RepID=A0A2Z7AJZ3_9LAMI|nr:hypothetical protein F511_09114 [Dorcoceras hygrometricum]
MSLFNLQDVCIAIGSLATLDLPMVVDLIGIYGLKGPYCTLTTTDWFLQALSVIPRGSWGDVARRFTMIRWADSHMDTQLNVLSTRRGFREVRLPKSQQGSNRSLPPLRGKTMPPRRRDRGREQIPEDSKGQNDDIQCSIPRHRRDRRAADECAGVQSSQSVQSSQPPQQQKQAQKSGHHRFRTRGRQFKKKSGSSSSGSGSSSSSSPRAELCGQCGGKHPTTQQVAIEPRVLIREEDYAELIAPSCRYARSIGTKVEHLTRRMDDYQLPEASMFGEPSESHHSGPELAHVDVMSWEQVYLLPGEWSHVLGYWIFLREVPSFPPEREIFFNFDSVPRFASTSGVPLLGGYCCFKTLRCTDLSLMYDYELLRSGEWRRLDLTPSNRRCWSNRDSVPVSQIWGAGESDLGQMEARPEPAVVGYRLRCLTEYEVEEAFP